MYERKMTLFGFTLCYLRRKQKLKLSGLADALGISETALRNIEDGYIEPEEELAKRLAAFFGVTVGYMRGSVEVELYGNETEKRAGVPTRFVRLRPMPLDAEAYENTAFRSGDSREIILPVSTVDRSDYMAVVATDNSMSRYNVLAGDILIVQSDPMGLRDGELALLKTALGQVVLRRFYRKEEEIVLKSDDDDLLPPIRFVPRDPSVQILGKVREIITNVDDTFLELRSKNPPRRPPEILPPPSFPLQKEEIPDTMYQYLFGEKEEKS